MYQTAQQSTPMFTQEVREEIAAKLSGRQYPFRLSKEEAAEAKRTGWVVLVGDSDDTMSFHGYISDEVSCFEGGVAYLDFNGLAKNDCDEDACPYFRKVQAMAATIAAHWDKDGYNWVYETGIKHATFDVLEGEKKYCRGIVFHMSDVVDSVLSKNAAAMQGAAT